MKNIFDFEYREGSGIFYTLDPLIKVFLVMIFWILTLYSGLSSLVLLTAVIFIIVIYSGLTERFLRQTRFFFLFVFPFIVIFQVLFHWSFAGENPGLFFFNPKVSIDGFVIGVKVGLRLFCLLSSSIIFIMTTSPLRLIRRISEIRVIGFQIPASVTFLFVFINRSVTLIFNDLERILEAQKARGFSLRDVGIRKRILGYIALLIPLLTISLERAQKQAIALELRGFRSKKVDIKTDSQSFKM
ncbi:MAG: hypothetical protein B6U86_02490 [Candidatus Altiarchaeales archaeon ex4484_43]|nr:MAG: hypothetical protein B6U86_02490 [Candidatus Altiarchaeales archaeon ex4484_43]